MPVVKNLKATEKEKLRILFQVGIDCAVRMMSSLLCFLFFFAGENFNNSSGAAHRE